MKIFLFLASIAIFTAASFADGPNQPDPRPITEPAVILDETP